MLSLRASLGSLIFALISITSSSTPSLAEDQTDNINMHGPKFSLSVMVMAKPQLSRSEVDPQAMGIASLATPPAQLALPPQTQNSNSNSRTANMPSKPAAPAAQTCRDSFQTQAAEDNAPDAYLKEYNVDWSPWISTVADRWFFVLRNAEYQLGIQFVTIRPALIQFTCYADGSIGNISLKQSSGVPAYDRLQVAALLQAIPTPPFPAGTHRQSITLVQGWESHPRRSGENDFRPGSFGRDFPLERVRKWCAGL